MTSGRDFQVSFRLEEIPLSNHKVAAIVVFLAMALFFVVRGPAQSPAIAPNSTQIEDLVYANRILADQGVVDGFGHVSVREDNNSNRFLLSRGIAPALVTSKDIMEYNLNGDPIDAQGRNSYSERYIHAAIYRARPDVKAIVHSHSLSVIPFSVTGIALRPIFHMSAFLGAGTPIFDIRDAAGMTDMLISNNQLGDALAKTLGDRPVALMRGHGMVAAGKTIQQAVFYAYYTEVNARLQMQAMALGKVNYLTPEEAAKTDATISTQYARPWELWKTRIGKIE